MSNLNEYHECDYKVDTNDGSNNLFKEKLTFHIKVDNSFLYSIGHIQKVMMTIKLKPWKIILTNYNFLHD